MQYQVGKIGRVVVAKFEDKEDVLGNLYTIVKKRGLPPPCFTWLAVCGRARLLWGLKRTCFHPPRFGERLEKAMRWLALEPFSIKTTSQRFICTPHSAKG